MEHAVSVRLDDEVQRALRTLEASGMSRSSTLTLTLPSPSSLATVVTVLVQVKCPGDRIRLLRFFRNPQCCC
jgi:hypothetical protein